MGHAHDHLADAIVRDAVISVSSIGTSASRPSMRERLLPEERRALVALHRVHLGEPFEEAEPVLDGQRRPVLARLDVLAQPDALLVARDVLDLEGDGAAVRRAKVREHLGEIAAGHVDAKQVGGDLLHQLLGQAVGRRVHRRIADRR